MPFPFDFSPAVQVIVAFALFVIGFLLLVLSIVVLTALAILVYGAVDQLRARMLKPSIQSHDDLGNLGLPKAHAKSVAVLPWKDGLREGLLGDPRHR